MHPVIVGIDPGTTSAFAVLTIDFDLSYVKSKRNYGLAEMISDIFEHGTPILVGTDKKDLPSSIKDFSQKTGTKVHLTAYDTKKPEKKVVVRDAGFLDYAANVHEIDAIASAIYAYNSIRQTLDKIDRFLRKEDRLALRDKVVLKVITEGATLQTALAELEKAPVEKKEQKLKVHLTAKEPTKEEKEILLLKRTVERFRQETEELERQNELLKNRKIDIGSQTKKIISFKEKRAITLEKENKRLRDELRKREDMIGKLNRFISRSKGMVLLKRVGNLGEDFKKREKDLAIEKDDMLLVDDISVISDNVMSGLHGKVKMIIYLRGSPGKIPTVYKEFLFVMAVPELMTNNFALIDQGILEKELARQSKKSKAYLDTLLQDYRRERQKELY
jgi:uncharacterized protein